MVLLDVLRDAPLTFRALRARCDSVSPSVLNTRLKDLRELGFVEAGEAGYAFTPLGRELAEQLAGLHAWSEAWAAGSSAAREWAERS
jgi:DNA-binding HxlR family transcriptional regulator